MLCSLTTILFTGLRLNIVPKPPQPPPLRVEGFHLFRAEGKSVGFTVAQEQAVGGIDILDFSRAGRVVFQYIRMPLLTQVAICSLDFCYAGQLPQTQQPTSLVNLGSKKGSSLHV